MKNDYDIKFTSFEKNPLFRKIPPSEREFIRSVSFQHCFSFQEFRQAVQASRDITMWQEGSLQSWWENTITPGTPKKKIFRQLQSFVDVLCETEKEYKSAGAGQPERHRKEIISFSSDKKIYGMCPVASDKTVCCQLRTIDAVQNCVFGCSYCSIQTFYTENIIIEKDVEKKLSEIEIDPDRFYHFGTGQASDSLAWGNREGLLDAHCRFSAKHPNILMEFKTKSKNIQYFLENDIPPNVVCSWSLNTQIVIDNEEHYTASLDERIASARAVADNGVKVAFHFHPMVYYSGWAENYNAIARRIMQTFSPEEVLFISFGSVTLIKPVVQKIRDLGNPSKILQMKFVPDPHGKLTYADDIKIKMFRSIHDTFRSWYENVFFYLCMEKESIWKESFGYVYPSNDIFEREFGKNTLPKCHVNTSRFIAAQPTLE